MFAGLERGGHLRVHGDHHLLLVGHLSVPVLDLLLDPGLERCANDGSADVDDPLLGRLRQVRRVRQVQLDVRLGADELADALEREVLVLRAVERLDLVVLQLPLPAVHEVFQEVNGDIF